MNEWSQGLYITIEIECWQYQVSSLCPHRAGRLKYGYVNKRRKTITCPLHRSSFSLEDGEQLSGPKCASLKVVKKQLLSSV